ncbi:hypothetical protein L1987_74388 [Smallanthus sonchifolius]|uniref:Uncharacterized protein n=1 Tax=Smallanthus sonchifolius TaxID=185202 RepID=A0ACB9A2T6_9ASTR|nr:hypothetical protein L1987_74388 [Smallanthus sonchifolius]
MSEPIPLNVMNSASSSKTDSSSRQYPFVGNEVNGLQFPSDMPDYDPIHGAKYWNLDLFQQLLEGKTVEDGEGRLCYDPPKRDETGEDIHKPPPPQPRVVAEPRVEPRVVDPVCVDPRIARTKGKDIMEDGFIKVTKKKKKNNGPKPRVQIPSLHVSKPGPSKPLGRARPNVTRVTVSNPFEALDDVNQIDDGFPKLNATLKKFAMRYVKEKTIPDPDVFKTWSTDLKEYYYSLIKDDGEEVESETDGTAKMMSTGVS